MAIINIVLTQEDFDKASVEMSEEEFKIAWEKLGEFVRARAKRISETEE
jgi:hypothetical protein